MTDNKDDLTAFYENILNETEKKSIKLENETQQILKSTIKRSKRLITINKILIGGLSLIFSVHIFVSFIFQSRIGFNPISVLIVIIGISGGLLSISYLKAYKTNLSESLLKKDSNSLKHAFRALDSYLKIKSLFFIIGFIAFFIILISIYTAILT
jgi:hypothetical protein